MEAGGFEDCAEFAGFFEIEQELALAGHFREDEQQFFEELGVGVVQRHLDAEGFGELDLHVFERGDRRDGELGGGVFFAAEGAADENGDIDFELLFEVGEVFGEGDEVEFADRIFKAGRGRTFRRYAYFCRFSGR